METDKKQVEVTTKLELHQHNNCPQCGCEFVLLEVGKFKMQIKIDKLFETGEAVELKQGDLVIGSFIMSEKE